MTMMTRNQLNREIAAYFIPQELVCRHVFDRFGSRSYDFMDARLLEVLLWLRKNINKPIYANNWDGGGALSQRGYRCNMCDIVKSKKTAYLSAHTRGQALDFDVKGMAAEDVRKWIEARKAELPHNIRLESGVSWVHIDVCNETQEKIVYFKG